MIEPLRKREFRIVTMQPNSLDIGMVASSHALNQSIPGTILAVSEGVVAARRHGNTNQDGCRRIPEVDARSEILNRSYSIQGFGINRVRRPTESRIWDRLCQARVATNRTQLPP